MLGFRDFNVHIKTEVSSDTISTISIKNILPNFTGSASIGGVTFTVNTDGTVNRRIFLELKLVLM